MLEMAALRIQGKKMEPVDNLYLESIAPTTPGNPFSRWCVSMTDALISGGIHGKAVQRTDQQTGNLFYTAKVRTPSADGEMLFVSKFSFLLSGGAGLLALDDGDLVCLSGALTLKLWNDSERHARIALDMVTHAVTTAYHVARKRTAVRGDAEVPAGA